MKIIIYPWRLYARTFALCTLVIFGSIFSFNPPALFLVALIVYGCGAAVVYSTRLVIKDGYMTYRHYGKQQVVDLKRLKQCVYGKQEQNRGFPRKVFWLIDSADNEVALPAALWWPQRKLYGIILQAVKSNGLKIDQKTISKLH